MGIRSVAKAIILHDNKILLDKCYAPDSGNYFTLPGGGQEQYETMEEAVVRECLEETGYTVIPDFFVALYEEIYTIESIKQKYPDYSHKILHIFRCSLSDVPPIVPSEQDSSQLGYVWVDLDEVTTVNLLPSLVLENIHRLLDSEVPLFLGSHFIDRKYTEP